MRLVVEKFVDGLWRDVPQIRTTLAEKTSLVTSRVPASKSPVADDDDRFIDAWQTMRLCLLPAARKTQSYMHYASAIYRSRYELIIGLFVLTGSSETRPWLASRPSRRCSCRVLHGQSMVIWITVFAIAARCPNSLFYADRLDKWRPSTGRNSSC